MEDGGGLRIVKGENGDGRWVYRFSVHGRRREMGLGNYPAVSLKEARNAADYWRSVVRDGRDPIREREKKLTESMRSTSTLEDVALEAFDAMKPNLKGDGKNGRWFSPVELHILPKLGKSPIVEIASKDIQSTLAPIWHTKPEVAKKAINRLGMIMKFAVAKELDVDLQATEKAKILLGPQNHKARHVPAVHWKDAPDFYVSLNNGGVTHLALRMTILTAMRVKPVRFMRYDQIADDVWTIPADMMKGRKNATSDFHVPLSSEAIRVLKQAKPLSRDGYVFPGMRSGVISDMSMSQMMKRRGMKECPHGFRSTFRDWVADNEVAPYEVAETCLAHSFKGAVQRAYHRTDYLEQRRAVMNAWGAYVAEKAS